MGGALMKPPGGWLYTIAEQHLDAESVHSLIAPTIADLQYELAEAGPHWLSRTAALCRGYVAVVRLVTHSQWKPPMRNLLVVLLLGAVGAVSAITVASSTRVGPAPLAAVLIVAAISVAVLRFMRLNLTYRQAFLNSVGIGLLTLVPFTAWTVREAGTVGIPWYAYPLVLGFIVFCVGSGSALAAAVAWEPPVGRRPVLRTISIQILTGCGVFAVAHFVIGFLWAGGANLAAVLGWTAFRFFFFAAVASVLYVPIILVVGRLIRVRLPMAVVGAALFPIPLLGLPFLQGRGSSYARWLSGLSALEFVVNALPYVLAGAALGWLLATRRPEQMRSA